MFSLLRSFFLIVEAQISLEQFLALATGKTGYLAVPSIVASVPQRRH